MVVFVRSREVSQTQQHRVGVATAPDHDEAVPFAKDASGGIAVLDTQTECSPPQSARRCHASFQQCRSDAATVLSP